MNILYGEKIMELTNPQLLEKQSIVY